MPETLSHIRDQIEIIAKQEENFLHRRTRSERLGDSLGAFIGSLTFVSIHICWFGCWFLVNTLNLGIPHFDPYPFSLLNVSVALEAIFLASFILMRQSRTSRRSDERDHLILQILILTEKELTAVLATQRQVAAALGLKEVAEDAGIEQLSQPTPIDQIAETVKEHFADG
jgi:uncharacterized membrane protein